MTQTWQDFPASEKMKDSRPKIKERTETLKSHFSGTAFPTVDVVVGMTCYRTDQEKLYELRSTGPDTWVLIADLTDTYISKELADTYYQPLDADLTAISALSSTGGLERTGSNTWALYTLTAAGKALLDDADSAAQRTTLGLGTAALVNTGTGNSDVPTNSQLVGTARSFTKPQRAAISSVASATTITLDFADAQNFETTLGHNATFASPSNQNAGQGGSIWISQPSSGGPYTGTFNSAFKFPGGTAPTLSTAANAKDRVDYKVKANGEIDASFTADIK